MASTRALASFTGAKFVGAGLTGAGVGGCERGSGKRKGVCSLPAASAFSWSFSSFSSWVWALSLSICAVIVSICRRTWSTVGGPVVAVWDIASSVGGLTWMDGVGDGVLWIRNSGNKFDPKNPGALIGRGLFRRNGSVPSSLTIGDTHVEVLPSRQVGSLFKTFCEPELILLLFRKDSVAFCQRLSGSLSLIYKGSNELCAGYSRSRTL